MRSDQKNNAIQMFMDFDKPQWPDQNLFPLNNKNINRRVQDVVYADIENSKEYIIVTGFTSLSNLIDVFGGKDFANNRLVRVLIGFEPNIKGRKTYKKIGLTKEIREYWLKAGLSIMQGGAVMHLIDQIEKGAVRFKFKDKLHAKIYVGDTHAILGSANFSFNGLNVQEEANIRVENSRSNHLEQKQYQSIRQIADSYYDLSSDYNKDIIDLLKNLIKEVSWQEALARAIAEVLEGNWIKEYKDMITRLENAKLWPTQWKGLTQAISILQSQSNVLIADPTGAGKTKLCTSVVLSLQHWLYDIGKNYRTESLTICPPLVLQKWASEFKTFNRINHNQHSNGLLSTSGTNTDMLIEDLKLANILVIDEAHNYLSDSKRTNLIKSNRADYKILITATPISRKVEDILRLVDLLDIDNLTDQDFEIYKDLMFKPYSKSRTENVESLRRFISKFTVRRTKKALNKEIEKDEASYRNKLDKTCKFPKQFEKTYLTKETERDKEIVKQINELAKQIKGVTYLTSFRLPKFEITKEESLESFIKQRINGGKHLSIYMVRARLRSSHVALVEHIEGSELAMSFFGITGKNNETGNKLKIIQDLIIAKQLPKRHQRFKSGFFPDWLNDINKYVEACEKELNIYRHIATLAKSLSGNRELGKAKELVKVAKTHQNILAFDSTVITLYYLRSLFQKHFEQTKILLASGSESEKGNLKVLEHFKLDTKEKGNCIALCSDKMSESVDMQKASCVFLLDTPSVLRIVEQRIGRADRMDSMHESIDIYWAVDSEEYAMKTDERLIDINDMVAQIYGTNFEMPDILKERRFTNVNSTQDIIKEYKEFVDKDETWTGVHDSFQFVVNLKEGKEPLIDEGTYRQFVDVSSEVKTKVSFISCEKDWCFLSLRGDKNKSPRWYFIDSENHIHTDYPDVCQQLRENIKGNASTLKWDDEALKKYVKLFKSKEIELLPPKKKRALEVARYILDKKMKSRDISKEDKATYEMMVKIIKGSSTEIYDYEALAEEWIEILQPYLKIKRETNKRKKIIWNLKSLQSEYKTIVLHNDLLYEIADKCIIGDDVDKRIAACIIGVTNSL